MQAAMDRLAAFLERRRLVVLVAWMALLLAAVPFAARQSEHLTSGGFAAPGSQSATVDRNLERFESAQSEYLAVVLAKRPGAGEREVRAEIERVDRLAAGLPHMELTNEAATTARRQAADASITVMPLALDGSQDELADATVDLRDELGDESRAGVQPYLVGQQALWAGMQELAQEDLEAAETTGFPIVLLILLAVFGSLAAAALPLVLGLASVGLTGAVVYFLSQAMDMSVFVTNVASMIGIGVAVDYSLFVLARYREEIRRGAAPDRARRLALRTSGLAVAFSGVTVMVSLAGLWLVDSTTIRSMAAGAIIVVAISVLAAVTLLPVLMSLFGRRVYARGRIALTLQLVVRAVRSRARRPGSTRPEAVAARTGFWERWTTRVTRRPWTAALASAGVLLVLAIPALSLDFGDGALRQFPEGNTTRTGAELAAQKQGAGAAGPTQVVAELKQGSVRSPDNREALAAYADELARDPEVARVAPPAPSSDGRAALIAVQPRHDAESPQAEALVERLRAGAGPLDGRGRAERGRRDGRGRRLPAARLRLDVEDPRLRLRVQLPGAVPAAALGAPAAEGRADEPPVGGRGLRRARRRLPVGLARRGAGLRVARLHQHHDPALPAGHRVRAVDGLRGLPALADPRALRRHRRHHHRRGPGPAGQRGDHLQRGPDHGGRVQRLRLHRHPVDQGDRAGARGGDRPGRHPDPTDPGAGHDGAHGPLELVAARPAGAQAAARRLRGLARPSPVPCGHGPPAGLDSRARPRCCAPWARIPSRSPPRSGPATAAS